ncbi:alpha/beta fold hydrolase [Nocardia abscessus]|uniref:alpha/beta fold hydrolase n=1 Tax=Nocardia abscessus TaxID=120957 RepID=UPI0020D14320|nr:alpha/beta fold hydrolase [Nocardia abscessus]
MAEHLADNFEVVLINLRGHGTSGWGHSSPHISHMIDDVLAVIDAVGPVTTLFGYSYGAVIALETALAAPDRIDRLALYRRAIRHRQRPDPADRRYHQRPLHPRRRRPPRHRDTRPHPRDAARSRTPRRPRLLATALAAFTHF